MNLKTLEDWICGTVEALDNDNLCSPGSNGREEPTQSSLSPTFDITAKHPSTITSFSYEHPTKNEREGVPTPPTYVFLPDGVLSPDTTIIGTALLPSPHCV